MSNRTITFRIGQVVPWPAAPMGMAQIADLRRSKVQLVYPFKNGRIAKPVATASSIARLINQQPLLFELSNVYNRGIVKREKEFRIPPPNVSPPQAAEASEGSGVKC